MFKMNPLHSVSAWSTAWVILVVLGVIFTSATVFAQPAETWHTGLEGGVPWPEPRFTDNGDGTITDHLTGLVWLKYANCFGTRSWSDALSDSNTLDSGSCGLADGSLAGDWRLPNRKELFSLIDYSRSNPALPTDHPFINVLTSDYWSSSTVSSLSGGGRYAWRVCMSTGYIQHSHNKGSTPSYPSRYAVWPVRDGDGGIGDNGGNGGDGTGDDGGDANGDGGADGSGDHTGDGGGVDTGDGGGSGGGGGCFIGAVFSIW